MAHSEVEKTQDMKEVLIEHNGHKRRVSFFPVNADDQLPLKMAIFKKFMDILPESSGFADLKAIGDLSKASKIFYSKMFHLQIYNKKFDDYLDLLDDDEVNDGDKLKLTTKSRISKEIKERKIRQMDESDDDDVKGDTYHIAFKLSDLSVDINVDKITHQRKHRWTPIKVKQANMNVAYAIVPNVQYRIQSHCDGFVHIKTDDKVKKDPVSSYPILTDGSIHSEEDMTSAIVKFTEIKDPGYHSKYSIEFVHTESWMALNDTETEMHAVVDSNGKFAFDVIILERFAISTTTPVEDQNCYITLHPWSPDNTDKIKHYLRVTDHSHLEMVVYTMKMNNFYDPAGVFCLHEVKQSS